MHVRPVADNIWRCRIWSAGPSLGQSTYRQLNLGTCSEPDRQGTVGPLGLVVKGGCESDCKCRLSFLRNGHACSCVDQTSILPAHKRISPGRPTTSTTHLPPSTSSTLSLSFLVCRPDQALVFQSHLRVESRFPRCLVPDPQFAAGAPVAHDCKLRPTLRAQESRPKPPVDHHHHPYRTFW